MKIRNISLVILTGALMLSCKESEVPTYEEKEDRLFFYYGGTNASQGDRAQNDSIAHSFFLLPERITNDTVKVNVRTMGYPSGIDRPVSFRQINTNHPDAAVPGVHYVPFDDQRLAPLMMVLRDSVKADIPIVFLRDDLANKSVRLEFEIVENEYFKPGVVRGREFMITSTAMAAKPSRWDDHWGGWFGFGEYGEVKLWFIVNIVGFTAMDEISSMGYRDAMVVRARQRLLEYNAERVANGEEPLKEANGTPVVIGYF